jgi:hypothetical protein
MPRAKTPAPPQNVLNLMKQRFVIDEEGVISNLDTNPNKVHEKANCNGYITWHGFSTMENGLKHRLIMRTEIELII